jgi:hypothetical protein
MVRNNKDIEKVGVWAFIIGVILAFVGGIIASFVGAAVVTSILILLGLIVGFLNISDKETNNYLLASVSLVIVTALGGQILGSIAYVGFYLSSVLTAILTFVIPAVIIVALKAIYNIAKE